MQILKLISIPSSLYYIFNNAFQNCESLENISLPSMESIDKYLFQNCKSLKTIAIPSAVTKNRKGAFAG